jgi:alpha-N-arabinofuranosidase
METGRVGLEEHVSLVKLAIRQRAEGHRKLQPTIPSLEGRTMPISMDEWNYWHRDYAYGELGCIYELQDGLGIAAGLHEFYRHTDLIKAATYAQTVNVIGAIKTTKTAAEMEATGLVLQLYRAHYGEIPLVIAQDFGPLDVAAALAADGRRLTFSVVNPTRTAVSVALVPRGFTPGGPATRRHITGPDEFAHNTPGKPRVVDIHRQDGVDAAQPLEVPALSCALFEIPLK